MNLSKNINEYALDEYINILSDNQDLPTCEKEKTLRNYYFELGKSIIDSVHYSFVYLNYYITNIVNFKKAFCNINNELISYFYKELNLKKFIPNDDRASLEPITCKALGILFMSQESSVLIKVYEIFKSIYNTIDNKILKCYKKAACIPFEISDFQKDKLFELTTLINIKYQYLYIQCMQEALSSDTLLESKSVLFLNHKSIQWIIGCNLMSIITCKEYIKSFDKMQDSIPQKGEITYNIRNISNISFGKYYNSKNKYTDTAFPKSKEKDIIKSFFTSLFINMLKCENSYIWDYIETKIIYKNYYNNETIPKFNNSAFYKKHESINNKHIIILKDILKRHDIYYVIDKSRPLNGSNSYKASICVKLNNKYFKKSAYAPSEDEAVEKIANQTLYNILPYFIDSPEEYEYIEGTIDFKNLYDNKQYQIYTQKVNFTSKENILYIGKGTESCLSKGHNIISATGILKNANGDDVEIDVNHCLNCDDYFINQNKFQYYQSVYGLNKNILIGNFKIYHKDHSKYFDLDKESLLHICGYNVNKNNDLSVNERRNILLQIINNGIMPKYKVEEYLEYYINNLGLNYNMRNACQKWEEDYEWLLQYELESNEKVYIDKIEKYKH